MPVWSKNRSQNSDAAFVTRTKNVADVPRCCALLSGGSRLPSQKAPDICLEIENVPQAVKSLSSNEDDLASAAKVGGYRLNSLARQERRKSYHAGRARRISPCTSGKERRKWLQNEAPAIMDLVPARAISAPTERFRALQTRDSAFPRAGQTA